MDVDNSDLDMIMCRFRTMNTNDKDYLINEFKRLSNTQLGTEGCCFYLDLAEWNLNSALWAYYEYEAAAAAAAAVNASSTNQLQTYTPPQLTNELPEMQFLCDITIGEGESVAPNTNFIKTWRIKNTGAKRWPPGCQLRYVNGYNFSASSSNQALVESVAIDLRELEPQETSDISISLKSPQQCGIYQCQYRTYTSLNQPFGDPIWLLLNVEEGGLLGCIQQLSNVNMFGGNNTVMRNLSQQTNNNSEQTSSSTQYTINKSTVFKLDSNLNLVQNTSNRTSEQAPNLQMNLTDEEKRPDFYDDMFS